MWGHTMYEKVAEAVRRYEELSLLLASPEVANDRNLIRKYGQEQAELADVVEAYRAYEAASGELARTRDMLVDEADPEMRGLIGQEVERLEGEVEGAGERLRRLLVPKDPRDSRDVICEIRAGTGGD